MKNNYFELKKANTLQAQTLNYTKQRRRMILIGFITAIILIMICESACIKKSNDLSISDTQLFVSYNEYLGYSASITGVATNTSGRNLSYASIEFSVYDSYGNNLGTALANINNLSKGDTWRFEATLFDFPSTRPASYKLVEIIAY